MTPTDFSKNSQELRWYIYDNPSPLKDPDNDKQSSKNSNDIAVLRLGNGSGRQIVGFRPSSGRSSKSKLDAVEVRCADSAVNWIRHNEMDEGHPDKGYPNKAAGTIHFRSRLAHLTSYPITPREQGWDTEV